MITKRSWTEDETNYLRTNYGNSPTREIAQNLKRSIDSLQQQATRLGLKHPLGREPDNWTRQQDVLLRKLYPRTPKAEIARLLNRSFLSIYHRAHRLGIKRERQESPLLTWTNAELENLRAIYSRATRAELHAAFPNHPLSSVYTYANKMGLHRDKLPWYRRGKDHQHAVEHPLCSCSQCGKSLDRAPSHQSPSNYCCVRCKLLFERPPIELALRDALLTTTYHFEEQVKLGRWYLDFVVHIDGVNVAVECDGAYWHGTDNGDHQHPKQIRSIARDKAVKELIDARPDWELVRLDYWDLVKDMPKCIASIRMGSAVAKVPSP